MTLCGRPQVSLALRLAMLACAAAAYRNAKTGIEPANTYSSEGKFGSLYQRMALSHLVPPHDFTVIPFDLYCPSLENTLRKRICNHCAAYFPSQAAMKKHLIVHKQPCNQPVEDDEPAEATYTISSDALATVSDANDCCAQLV